jgi:hypothetical protein
MMVNGSPSREVARAGDNSGNHAGTYLAMELLEGVASSCRASRGFRRTFLVSSTMTAADRNKPPSRCTLVTWVSVRLLHMLI